MSDASTDRVEFVIDVKEDPDIQAKMDALASKVIATQAKITAAASSVSMPAMVSSASSGAVGAGPDNTATMLQSRQRLIDQFYQASSRSEEAAAERSTQTTQKAMTSERALYAERMALAKQTQAIMDEMGRKYAEGEDFTKEVEALGQMAEKATEILETERQIVAQKERRAAIEESVKDANRQQAEDRQAELREGNSGKNVASLATNLRSSVGEAQRLAQAAGLTAEETNKLIVTLNKLQVAGSTMADRYKILNSELGLTAKQFHEVDQAVSKVRMAEQAEQEAAQKAIEAKRAAREKERADREKESQVKAAAREQEKTAKDSERLIEKQYTTADRIRNLSVQGLEHSMQAMKGVAQLGLMSEKDSEALLKNLVAIEAFFNIIKGGVRTLGEMKNLLRELEKAEKIAVQIKGLGSAASAMAKPASDGAGSASSGATGTAAAGMAGSLGRFVVGNPMMVASIGALVAAVAGMAYAVNSAKEMIEQNPSLKSIRKEAWRSGSYGVSTDLGLAIGGEGARREGMALDSSEWWRGKKFNMQELQEKYANAKSVDGTAADPYKQAAISQKMVQIAEQKAKELAIREGGNQSIRDVGLQAEQQRFRSRWDSQVKSNTMENANYDAEAQTGVTKADMALKGSQVAFGNKMATSAGAINVDDLRLAEERLQIQEEIKASAAKTGELSLAASMKESIQSSIAKTAAENKAKAEATVAQLSSQNMMHTQAYAIAVDRVMKDSTDMETAEKNRLELARERARIESQGAREQLAAMQEELGLVNQMIAKNEQQHMSAKERFGRMQEWEQNQYKEAVDAVKGGKQLSKLQREILDKVGEEGIRRDLMGRDRTAADKAGWGDIHGKEFADRQKDLTNQQQALTANITNQQQIVVNIDQDSEKQVGQIVQRVQQALKTQLDATLLEITRRMNEVSDGIRTDVQAKLNEMKQGKR